MSREEHYFENLIYTGSDECAGNANKDTISDEAKETIEMCYEYIVFNIFHNRDNLDEFLGIEEEE